MKPTLIRSKKIDWFDGLVKLERNMLWDQVKQEANENSGVDALIKNEKFLSFDGTDVSCSIDNYVFNISERNALSPAVDETCLVTGISDTSSTSINLDTVGQTATIFVGIGLDYEIGHAIRVQSRANSANFFQGLIDDYNDLTGELNIFRVDTGGSSSGTHTDWDIVPNSMRLYNYNGSSWDFVEGVHGHLYPSGLQSWTPLDFYFDLGKNHNVSGIWGLYMKYPFSFLAGYPNPSIYVSEDFENWVLAGNFTSNNSLAANEEQVNFNVTRKCRFIRLAYEGASNSVSLNILPTAMAIIGTAVDGKRTKSTDFHTYPKTSRPAKKTFGDYACVNSVRENNLTYVQDQYQVAKFHRLFGNDVAFFVDETAISDVTASTWTVTPASTHPYPNDEIGFNPTYGGGGYNYDLMLSQMKANGIEPIPMLSRTIPYLNLDGSNQVHSWQIPHDTGGDPENPMDYKAWASLIFQFAARYGSNSDIDDSLFKVASGNSILKGLNYVYAIGLNNESDKDWISSDELMRPKAMAAFLSASIDGHMGLMGDGHGGRLADPNMKFLMNGLIESKTDYIKIVIKQLKIIRKLAPTYGYEINPLNNDKFIIDVHQYPVFGIGQNNSFGGAPVESSSFMKNAERVTKEIRYECPNAQIVITECGYDSTVDFTTSRVATPLTPTETGDANDQNYDSQAKHIIRLLMYGYISGFDQMYLFTLKDPSTVGGGGYKTTFNMAGMYVKGGGGLSLGDKKLSWYAFNTFRQRLIDYVYENHSIDPLNSNLHIIKLVNGSNDAYVVWLGSNDDSELVDEVISIGDKTSANKIEYASGVDLGNSSSLTVTDNTVTVTINEKPFLIIAT